MPYFGHTPTNAGSFIEIDDYGSSFNGSTTAFTLQVGGVDVTPNSQNILVMIDGVVQMPTSAYAISGSTITYTEAPPSGADSYVILMGQSASIGQGTIGADELKINGDGTSGQLVKSDGDGTYSYLNQTSVTAGTATTLATARTINGVSFDGSANITVTADANTLSNTTLKSTVVNSSLTSVGTLTSLNTTGAVTATGSDYMLKAVSTSTTNSDAIRVSAESGLAQGKIEIGWHNDSSQAGGGYGSIQVGKSANTPEIRIGASKITAINGGIQANNNDIIAKMTTAGSGIRVVADRVDQNDYGGFEIRNNGSQRWFIGMRELGNDDLQFFNGNSSSGSYQNVLSLNHSNANATFVGTVTIGTQQGDKELMTNRARMRHIDGVADANASFSHGDLYVNHISTGNIYMQRDTFFGGHITVDTGGTSIVTVDGNNTSGDDGRVILKGHTASNSRAFIHLNNGVSSGGLDWRIGCLRYSNAFVLSLGNDDYNNSTNVISVDGNRKIGIGTDPGSAKLTVSGDVTISSSTTTAGITSSNVIYSQMSSTSDYGNTGFRTLDGSNNEGLRIEHGGGKGRVLLYDGNNHRGTMEANKFTSHTNGQTLGTTANEQVIFLQNNGNAARITTSKSFETYGGFYTNSAGGGYDHGLTTHTNEFNPIVNWQSGYGRVHFSYRANNTYQDWTFYNGSSSGYSDLEAAAFNVTSDYRMKKTVTDFTNNVCDSIKELRPVTYFWKANTKMHTTKQIGFLAHELQEKLPLSVKGEKDAINEKGDIDPQTIKTEALATYLVKGMQEIIERLEKLEAK